MRAIVVGGRHAGEHQKGKNMGFMAGKRALIVGVASARSNATGIAEAFAREGAENDDIE